MTEMAGGMKCAKYKIKFSNYSKHVQNNMLDG